MKSLFHLFLLTVALTNAWTVLSADMVVNGDFSLGDTSFATDYARPLSDGAGTLAPYGGSSDNLLSLSLMRQCRGCQAVCASVFGDRGSAGRWRCGTWVGGRV